MTTINYTKTMIDTGAYGAHNLIKAEGRDNLLLLLRKLDEPTKRLDGKKAGYEVELRYLSATCENEEDEAYVCVNGSDFSLWLKKEIKKALEPDQSLFDHFDCF